MPTSPDFNQVITSICPSVLVPWGWHTLDTKPAVGICYNSYKRTIVYEKDEVLKSHSIFDKFATEEDSGRWLAERLLGKISERHLIYDFQFEVSLKGGIQIGQKSVLSPLSPDITQKIAENFLVMTRASITEHRMNSNINPFFWGPASGIEFEKIDHIILDQMTNEIIYHLKKGDLESVGKVSEKYWFRWSSKLGGPFINEPNYQNSRVAGAYGGFPVDWEATTYCLLAPPDKHDRIKNIMAGWTALPYEITPFGARICGTF